MAEVTNRTVNIYVNSGEAQKVYDTLIAKEKKLNEELAKTSDPRRIQKLKAELDKLQEPITRASKKLSGELSPSIKEMDALVGKLRNQLSRMSKEDADYSRVNAQYVQARANLARMRVELNGVEDAHQRVAKTNPFGRVLEYAKGAFLGSAMFQAIGSFEQFLSDSITEALAAEEGTARFRNTLENLGRLDAFDRIIAKADEMAEKFRYLDNDDVVGVFNKLIDYGKLTEAQMNDLLPVIINFAAKQRITLEESASVIVKALEGQGRALKEYGIELSTTSSTADNLNVVMTTLAQKVDGAAEAFQDSAAGGIASARQELANIKEEVGTNLIPVLATLLTWLNKLIQGFGQLKTNAGNAFSDLWAGMTGGKAAIDANREARGTENRQRIEKQAASELAQTVGKDELQARLDAQRKLYAAQSRGVKEGFSTKEELMETAKAVRVLKMALKELEGADNNNVLGAGGYDANKDKDKNKGAKKVDQVAQDQKKLLEIIKAAQFERTLFEESEENKRIMQAAQKWEEHRKLAHGNRELLKRIDEAYWAEVLQIQVEYGRKSLDERLKQQREQTQRLEALGTKTQRGLSSLGTALGKNDRNIAAGIETDLMRASGKQRLQLHLQLLEQEKKMALQNTELTENEKRLIEEQYRQAALDSEREYYMRLFENIMSFVSQAVQVLDTFAQAKTNKENQELERDRKVNEQKKKNWERQLNSKQMTQMEFDRKVAELEEEQEKKEKATKLRQFRREQRLAVAKAFISAAEGSLKTVAEWGMPLAIPFLALVAAQLIGQIALINSQKPQFARGGKLNGPSHFDNKGMPVTNPRTGEVQAYLEGGEAITNKRTMADRRVFSAKGTPSQIISSLNGLHGGVEWDSPAQLVPGWKTMRPQPMNYGAIRKAYADGGLYGAARPAASSGSSGESEALMQVIRQMNSTLVYLSDTVGALQAQLASGIYAVASVQQISDGQARLEAIKADATYRPSAVKIRRNPKIDFGYVTEEPTEPAP